MVTGIGHIGGYVVRDLLAAGHRVVIYGYCGGSGQPTDESLADLEYLDQLLGACARPDVAVEIGDVADLDHLVDVMQRHGVRKVIHLASLVSAAYETSPMTVSQVNVSGTAAVFDAAKRLNLHTEVWPSSIEVCGARSADEFDVVANDAPPDPPFVCGAGKVLREKLAAAYCADHDLDITGLRLSRVCGFGEHVKFGRDCGSSWLASPLYHPAVGSEPSAVPFGRRQLDFHSVKDVSTAFVKALDVRDGSGTSYTTHSDWRSMNEVFDFMRSLLPDADLSLSIEDIPLPNGSSTSGRRQFDTRRAERHIGTTDRFDMEVGIYWTINSDSVHAGPPRLSEPDVFTSQLP